MELSKGNIHFDRPKDLNEDSYKDIIREIGLKVTGQRLKILEIILKGRSHVSAQSVFENVIKTNPEIGFATVYRFLRTLSESGYLSEVRVGGQPARYEWAHKKHHDHLSCTSCHKICEFENQEIEDLQEKIAKQFGFTLTNHILELYGLCSDCHTKNLKN